MWEGRNEHVLIFFEFALNINFSASIFVEIYPFKGWWGRVREGKGEGKWGKGGGKWGEINLGSVGESFITILYIFSSENNIN